MKRPLFVFLAAVNTLLITLSFRYNISTRNKDFTETDNINHSSAIHKTMLITIGATKFKVTLVDNATVTAFKARLPMTINMTELNGNEKYFDLATALPARAANPGEIRAGDLMLYGSKTLVLFYKSFKTPYSYTRLGHVENTAGLTGALGGDDISVRFELE